MTDRKLKNLLKTASAVVIVIVGILSMALLGSSEIESNKRETKQEPRLVQTELISFENISLSVAGNGIIESQRTLIIFSEVAGIIDYAKNNLKDGTYVEEGEDIIKIDQRQVENSLYSMRSDFMNSIASVLPDFKIEDKSIYDKWYKYFLNLKIDENIPELPQSTNSQEKIKLSGRNIYNKYFTVKNQEILLNKHSIKAPYSGFITNSSGAIVGSYVSQGKELFTLNDVSNLEIAVPLLVEEVNMLEFSKNPKVLIHTDKAEVDLIGRVVRRETSLNKNSQTINVYVLFDNHELNPYYLPGNYVRVSIEGRMLNNVAKIPRNVIDGESSIFTIEEGKLNKKKVDVIAFQNNEAIIKNNIPANTQVVTTILQKPLIGMEIRSSNEKTAAEEKTESADSSKGNEQLADVN